jgi:hypothetical protein
MGLGLPLIDAISATVGKITDKIWMDKGEKEKLEFTKNELFVNAKLAVSKLEQEGELSELELVFKESQAQRDYAKDQFGSAKVLKDFFLGRIILFGRASIRWVITGFAMWQAHRMVTHILTEEVMKNLAAGNLSTSAVWVIGMLVTMIIGIPLFYVAGISIEKLFKSRGLI